MITTMDQFFSCAISVSFFVLGIGLLQFDRRGNTCPKVVINRNPEIKLELGFGIKLEATSYFLGDSA